MTSERKRERESKEEEEEVIVSVYNIIRRDYKDKEKI